MKELDIIMQSDVMWILLITQWFINRFFFGTQAHIPAAGLVVFLCAHVQLRTRRASDSCVYVKSKTGAVLLEQHFFLLWLWLWLCALPL
jgi:hypothetical protein